MSISNIFSCPHETAYLASHMQPSAVAQVVGGLAALVALFSVCDGAAAITAGALRYALLPRIGPVSILQHSDVNFLTSQFPEQKRQRKHS